MQTPEGFAPVDSRETYLAVSPERVRLQGRSVANEPRQDAVFWTDALSHQLLKQGYAAAGAAETNRSGDTEGGILWWLMPYGTETWSYMTAIVVVGRRIVVVEAAGERALCAKHRATIVASLGTLSLWADAPSGTPVSIGGQAASGSPRGPRLAGGAGSVSLLPKATRVPYSARAEGARSNPT